MRDEVSLAVRKNKKYTYDDYCAWPEEERWEIIDGYAYNMSPAPTLKHQRIVSLLDRKLSDKVESKGCSLFIAPADVVFDNYNIVQPDVFVVCDKKKITEANIQGAPDLILEIISPSTELKDKREKKRIYERFGVAEYIIIYPEREYLEKFILDNSRYGAPEVFNWDEIMKLHSFDITLNLWEIFEKDQVLPVKAST